MRLKIILANAGCRRY